MNQNPYLKDWLRSIESMNEEELIKAIEDDSRSEEFTKLARERLAFLRSDNAPKKVWEEKAESTERIIRKKENNNEIKKDIDNSAENTLSFFAVVTLVVGIIAGIVLLVLASNARNSEVPSLVLSSVGVIITALITWATLKVFVNISKTLKEINCHFLENKNKKSK